MLFSKFETKDLSRARNGQHARERSLIFPASDFGGSAPRALAQLSLSAVVVGRHGGPLLRDAGPGVAPGGGEGVEGIYGSITATGMHKVLECMRHNCGLGRSSALVDVGAGLGRPLLHALLLQQVAAGYGVELDRIKVAKAEAFCAGVLEELAARGAISSSNGNGRATARKQQPVVQRDTDDAAPGDQAPDQQQQPAAGGEGSAAGDVPASSAAGSTAYAAAGSGGAGAAAAAAVGGRGRAKQTGVLAAPQSRPVITCASIERIASLEPASHAYSFWEGVPLSGKRALGRLFRTARTTKAVAVVQRAIRGVAPEAAMAELGFGPLLLIKTFAVNMSGSGRSFTAYVFSKVPEPSAALLMRCAPSAHRPAAAAASGPDEVAGAGLQLEPGLESTSKPQRSRSRLAAAAGGAGRAGKVEEEEEEDDDDDADGSGLPLVQLLTEATYSKQQQQQLVSPGKRHPGAGAAAGDADDDGSPSKKQRGQAGAQTDNLAAAPTAAAGAGYGLRPRQLSYSSSGSGLSSSRSSRSASSAAAASTTRQTSRRAAGASAAAAEQSMSVSMQRSSSGTRATAVSGGSSKSSSTRKAAGGKSSTAAAAGNKEAAVPQATSSQKQPAVPTRRQQKLQQQHDATEAAQEVSEARGAVAAMQLRPGR